MEIEPMTRCLHGSECYLLSTPSDNSPICLLNRVPIFDIRRFPDGLWWIDPEPFKDAIPKKPKVSPIDRKNCLASRSEDYADCAHQGLLCFHYAYYLGKSGKPKP